MNLYTSVPIIKFGNSTILLFIFVFSLSVTNGQPPQGNSFEQYMAMADVASSNYDVYNEIEFSKKAYEFKPLDSLAKRISIKSEELRDYNQAFDWLQIYSRNPAYRSSEDELRLCRLLKVKGDIDNCQECLSKLLSTANESEIKSAAKRELESLELFSMQREDRALSSRPLDVLNSLYAENNPLFYDGKLFFTSVRKDVPITKKQKKRAPSTIWSSVWQNNKIYAPSKVSFGFLKDIKEVGDFSISADGNNYMITDWMLEGTHLSSTKLFLYQEGKGLTEIEFDDFDIILDPIEWKVDNESKIIFSSYTDRGDLDLFISSGQNGNYSKPTPLSENINTSGDEKSPFIHNGLLYFASNGHESMGGFDIFTSKLEDGSWSSPKNLLYPINSTYDDDAIAIDATQTHIVVSSNRKGSASIVGSNCCNDLYLIEESDIDISLDITSYAAEDEILPDTHLKLFKIVKGKPFFIHMMDTNNEGKAKIILEQNNEYELVASKKGYSEEKFNISTQYIQNNKEIITDIRLVKGSNNQNNPPSYILPNLNYPYKETKLTENAKQSLDSLVQILKENPSSKIEIFVHSEINGASQKMTQKRADAIAKYINKSGVSSSRVSAVGKGDSEPLYDCKTIDCSLAQKTLNRRVEVRYMGELKVKTIEPDSQSNSLPIITIENNNQDFGSIKKGESISGEFSFTNTGDVPLLIELATACVCTKLDWPLEEIGPGESATISFVYDSNLKEGEDFLDEVVVDIIANTKPIVTEAFFKVYIEAP